MTYVLGVLGSPRQGGNSEMLLDAALDGARSTGARTEKVVLSDLRIQPCTACDGCADGSQCVLDDDMVPLYAKLEKADVIILASPVYFYGVTAQMKAFIDRAQPFWVRKFVLHHRSKRRRGAFLSVGARIRTDFVAPEASAQAFFHTLEATPSRSLTFAGFEERGSIADHPTALQDAERLGRELAGSAGPMRCPLPRRPFDVPLSEGEEGPGPAPIKDDPREDGDN